MLMSILIAIYVSIAILIMCIKTPINLTKRNEKPINILIINFWLALFWPIVFIIYSFILLLKELDTIW